MESIAFAVFALVAMVVADKPEAAPQIPVGYNPAANLVLLPFKQAAYTAPPAAPGFAAPFYPFVPFPAPAEKPAEATNAKSEVETVTPTTTSSSTAAPAESAKSEVQSGQYYILSPEGKLQKVEFFTAAQPQSEVTQKTQQYNAAGGKAPAPFKGSVSSFQYKDVEPITAPIYSYTNVPGPLVRILRQAEDF